MDDANLNASQTPTGKRERSFSLSTSQARGEAARSDASPRGHGRSLSGSVFARIPFLRSHTESTPGPDDGVAIGKGKEPELHAQRSSAMAAALEQQGRKRKGSLRKAAMLGTGLLRRDRSTSNADGNRVNLKLDQPLTSLPQSTSLASRLSPRRFTFELPSETSSTEAFPDLQQQLTIDTASVTPQAPAPEAISPTTSPVITHESLAISPTSTCISTTDDDDRSSLRSSIELPVNSPVLPPSSKPRSPSPSPPSSISSIHLVVPYRPPSIRQRSTKSTVKSPLAVAHPSHPDALSSLVASSSTASISIAASEDWDYTETEWWGWVVLVVTWIVFVVGMGSCLDVWSWAWDVGETPYAPPELEDDPTLPIVGYYPALIVMTAVMSWVWVVVAWVGMKYFKHAKIQGD